MRLIDADELEYVEVHNKEYGRFYAVSEECINSLPTIEPPQGKWQLSGMGTHNPTATCSQCGYKEYFPAKRYNYCPNCGAKMNAGEDVRSLK